MNIPHVTDVKNDEQVARHLLEANANVNATDEADWTALMFASQDGHADVRRLLIGDFIHHQSNFNEHSGRQRRYKSRAGRPPLARGQREHRGCEQHGRDCHHVLRPERTHRCTRMLIADFIHHKSN